MNGLRTSTGCGRNKEIMKEILNKIIGTNDSYKLVDFLNNNFPHIIEKSEKVSNNIFPDFNPHILTYPHRTILTGSDLHMKTKEFIKNKGKSKYYITNDAAYIEYLHQHENMMPIPEKNWILAKYMK